MLPGRLYIIGLSTLYVLIPAIAIISTYNNYRDMQYQKRETKRNERIKKLTEEYRKNHEEKYIKIQEAMKAVDAEEKRNERLY